MSILSMGFNPDEPEWRDGRKTVAHSPSSTPKRDGKFGSHRLERPPSSLDKIDLADWAAQNFPGLVQGTQNGRLLVGDKEVVHDVSYTPSQATYFDHQHRPALALHQRDKTIWIECGYLDPRVLRQAVISGVVDCLPGSFEVHIEDDVDRKVYDSLVEFVPPPWEELYEAFAGALKQKAEIGDELALANKSLDAAESSLAEERDTTKYLRTELSAARTESDGLVEQAKRYRQELMFQRGIKWLMCGLLAVALIQIYRMW